MLMLDTGLRRYDDLIDISAKMKMADT